MAADFDRDGVVDLYVANDITPNNLFVREPDTGCYIDRGLDSGTAVDAKGGVNASMGIAITDFSHDERFDLVVSNFQHEDIAFYRQAADGVFSHDSAMTGLTTANPGVVGFGIGAADFDSDGYEDLLLTSGHVQYRPDQGAMGQRPLFIANRGGTQWRLAKSPEKSYFRNAAVGRGLALADLDRDGDLDAVMSHLSSPPAVLENVRGQDNSWLCLRLVGTRSSRDVIGAVATLTVGEHAMVRQRFSGGSYLSQHQPALFWGWDGDETATLEVDWPNGKTTLLNDLEPCQQVTLVEP